jgi:3'(2'), 5'-bisphosphate nucleotidase
MNMICQSPVLTLDQALVVRAAVLRAGDAIMEIFRDGELGTHLKADESPVTRADLAADAIVMDALEGLVPGVAVVSEERAHTWSEKAPDRFFIIDPLDGTKEFVKRGCDFTVNVGLIDQGFPVAGFVYAPAIGRLFWTHPDKGAVEEQGPFGTCEVGTLVPLNVCNDCSGALDVVASKSHRDAATDAYIARYPVAGFLSTGSSLKFCLVASGEAHLYPRLGRTMEWDTAAGDALLRAAGGKMLCYETQAPMTYGKPGYANGNFVAAAQDVPIAPKL